MAEYIYRNTDDTIRVRIFKREFEDMGRMKSHWDIDVFDRDQGGYTKSVCIEGACIFDMKRDAKNYADENYGPLTSIQPKKYVTDGWEK